MKPRNHDLRRQAETLRQLHQGPELLLLPNIWDPLGAILLQSMGLPAVATASAAVSYAQGWDDGQQLPFSSLLDIIAAIARVSRVPLTVDVEGGYAETPDDLAHNIRQVMAAGAAGINLEDSLHEGGPLRPIREQCQRLRAVRSMAREEGVPLFINARIDVFFSLSQCSEEEKREAAIERGQAYAEAGADGLYPMGACRPETIGHLTRTLPLPVNVYVRQGMPTLTELAALGVRRASLGPNLLRPSLEAMRTTVQALLDDSGYDRFADPVVSSATISKLVRQGREDARRPDPE